MKISQRLNKLASRMKLARPLSSDPDNPTVMAYIEVLDPKKWDLNKDPKVKKEDYDKLVEIEIEVSGYCYPNENHHGHEVKVEEAYQDGKDVLSRLDKKTLENLEQDLIDERSNIIDYYYGYRD